MEVTAQRLTDSKFEIVSRHHHLICDQPVDNGGTDAGISPPEFLLASLAACAGYYAAQYLKTRSVKLDDLTVRVSADKARNPARLGSFRIEVTATGLESQHEGPLLRAVKACLIHNTLMSQPSVEIGLNCPVPA